MKRVLSICLLFVSAIAFAQDFSNPEKFRSIILDGEQAYMEIATGKFFTPKVNQNQSPTVEQPEYSAPLTATSNSSGSYVVQSGDTLYSISKRFGLDIKKLMRLNQIQDVSELAVGQQLYFGEGETYLYSPNKEISSDIESQTHTVKKGDTLYSISKRYGITVDQLKRKNNLSSNTIFIGQKIFLD